MKVIFKLEQKARKSGGDKYIAEHDESFNVYFPQAVSRDGNGKPLEKIVVDIDLSEG